MGGSDHRAEQRGDGRLIALWHVREEIVCCIAQRAVLKEQGLTQSAVHRAAGLVTHFIGCQRDELVHGGIALTLFAAEVESCRCTLRAVEMGDGEFHARIGRLRRHHALQRGRQVSFLGEVEQGRPAHREVWPLDARAAGKFRGNLLEAAEAVDRFGQVVDARLAGSHGLFVGRGHGVEVEVEGLVCQMHFFLPHLATVDEGVLIDLHLWESRDVDVAKAMLVQELEERIAAHLL